MKQKPPVFIANFSISLSFNPDASSYTSRSPQQELHRGSVSAPSAFTADNIIAAHHPSHTVGRYGNTAAQMTNDIIWILHIASPIWHYGGRPFLSDTAACRCTHCDIHPYPLPLAYLCSSVSGFIDCLANLSVKVNEPNWAGWGYTLAPFSRIAQQ